MKTHLVLICFCYLLSPCGIAYGVVFYPPSPMFAFQVSAVEVLGTQAAGQSLQSGQNARPAAVQAGEDDTVQDEGAASDSTSNASPFEVRYLISYLVMLIFIGGGTFLVVRPTGRISQDTDEKEKKDKDKKKQKK